MRLNWLPSSPLSCGRVAIQLLVGQGIFRCHPASEVALLNELDEAMRLKLLENPADARLAGFEDVGGL